jgi:hypothetical protein
MKEKCAGHHLLMTAIPVTQEEIRKIMVQRQLGQIVCNTLSQKHLSQKKGWWIGFGIVPDLKPQFCPPHQKKIACFKKWRTVRENKSCLGS